MSQESQNSAVPTKYSQNKKEEKETSASAIVSGAVLVAFLNAYIYFFGYTYFKAKMASLGFDSATIEDDIGAVYYNAFECFGYILQYGLLPFIKSIDYTLLFKFYDTPIILTVVFFLFIYFYRRGRRLLSARIEKHAHLIEKKRVMLAAGFSISIVGLIIVFMFVWFLIITILTLFLYLCLPVLTAERATNEAIDNFTCEPPDFAHEKFSKRHKILGCTTIFLKDNTSIIASIFYADDKNLYLLTRDDHVILTKTLSIDEVQTRSQKIYLNKTAN